MDDQSHEMMRVFVGAIEPGPVLDVVDIGSMDIYGSYKDLFPPDRFRYTGVDIEAGKNVDVVAKDPYHYPFKDATFDVVISGQCLEHVEDMYRWADEVTRILKPKGVMAIIVPSSWPEHKYPLDCWRFYPDGLRWLFVKRTNRLKELGIKCEGGRQTIGMFRKDGV